MTAGSSYEQGGSSLAISGFKLHLLVLQELLDCHQLSSSACSVQGRGKSLCMPSMLQCTSVRHEPERCQLLIFRTIIEP